MTSGGSLLSVRDLSVRFGTARGEVDAVSGVSFDLAAGRILSIVGESGSGKSVTAMTVMQLLPENTPRRTTGEVLFDGRDLMRCDEPTLASLRGRSMSIVFQDPMSSLNPILTIGRQIAEPLRLHLGLSASDARTRVIELLGLVGIPSPAEAVGSYPHQLSGGQRQRVMIAIALACQPKLLIADEPTTALDVTTQAQILDLLKSLQRQFHMAIILITHDLGVVAEFADEVLVMYAGRVVERAPCGELFLRPHHPYTRGLLASIPPFDDDELDRLPAIGGAVPSPYAMPKGCSFHPRCSIGTGDCTRAQPALVNCGSDHVAACIKASPVLAGVAA